MKLLARHKNWVAGATISELESGDGQTRRFTATIDGYRGWHIWEGSSINEPNEKPGTTVALIRARVAAIQARIRAGDESVFTDKEPWFGPIDLEHCTCNLGWEEHPCPYHTRRCVDDI